MFGVWLLARPTGPPPPRSLPHTARVHNEKSSIYMRRRAVWRESGLKFPWQNAVLTVEAHLMPPRKDGKHHRPSSTGTSKQPVEGFSGGKVDDRQCLCSANHHKIHFSLLSFLQFLEALEAGEAPEQTFTGRDQLRPPAGWGEVNLRGFDHLQDLRSFTSLRPSGDL